MKFKTWRLGVLAVSFIFSVSASAEVLTVDETATPLRVDGHLSNWPAARMILLDQPSQVVSGKSYWKSAEDFSGRVFITYDSLYLYVAAIINKKGDVVNSNDPLSLWNGDCLELFLSVQPDPKDLKRLSGGEFRIAFSPGKGCQNPQMFCLNKDMEIEGGRLVARTAKTGYILEACVPLTFFGGLEVGPGKRCGFDLVLDEGGPLSGNRIMQLDYTGHSSSWEHPWTWGQIQWIGKSLVSVPVRHFEDLYANLVKDGTQGANYMGLKNFQGLVVDPAGKPLAGARVTTWPKTTESATDAQGHFELERVKGYDQTVLYARLDGYASSLSLPAPRGGAATLRLWPLPKGFDGEDNDTSHFSPGMVLKLPPQGAFSSLAAGTQDSVKLLQPKILRLTGLDGPAQGGESEQQILGQFMAYAKAVGAEPMITVPVRKEDPGKVAEWVRYCNVEKKYGVRYWAVGDELDRNQPGAGSASGPYSAYDYINDYRVIYDAMKTMDPSIFILGPELAWKYTRGENDWLTPFLQYNGDIVNMVSIHHYAALTADQCTAKALRADLKGKRALFQSLKDKISGQLDVFVPLIVTGSNTCGEKATVKTADDAGPQGFWAALWAMDELETALQEHLGINLYSYLEGEEGMAALAPEGPKPTYWAYRLFGNYMGGNAIDAQIQQADMSVYATQNPTTKDVTLLIINKGDRYYRPKIMLNGKDGDLTVEAGLNQRVDYEIPSFSISFLRIKADNSPGEVILYTRKLAQAGKEPAVSILKPW